MKDIPYNVLKKNGKEYEIMLLRDQSGSTFADIGRECKISAAKAREIYNSQKIRQIRLYINHIAIALGHENNKEISKVYNRAWRCYQHWTYCCAYLEKKYKDILTEYRNGEPGMPRWFIISIPPLRSRLSPKEVSRIIEMRESEKTSFIAIAKELRITPEKARHTYEWFYHAKMAQIIWSLEKKAENREEITALRKCYFSKNMSSKNRYDILIEQLSDDKSETEYKH